MREALAGEALISHPLAREALTCEGVKINIDEKPVKRIQELQEAIAASRSSCVLRREPCIDAECFFSS